MTWWDAIFLGIIQGLTEFIPISSNAHLKIIPVLLGKKDPGAAFVAVIQWGTVLAVIIYFRKDIWLITRAFLSEFATRKFGRSPESRLGWLIVLGTLPIVIVGLSLRKQVEGPLRNLYAIAITAIVAALWLMWAEFYHRWRARAGRSERELYQLTWRDALLIGLAQVLALIPGASRSGVTITAALFLGTSRSTAARFSFLLSLPAVFGAGVLELWVKRHELAASQDSVVNLVTCTIVSGLVGYASIAWLLTYLKTHTTWIFIIYRILLGAVLLVLLWQGLVVDRGSEDEAEARRGRRVDYACCLPGPARAQAWINRTCFSMSKSWSGWHALSLRRAWKRPTHALRRIRACHRPTISTRHGCCFPYGLGA
jgi:undecaprenyl-diphosphatase